MSLGLNSQSVLNPSNCKICALDRPNYLRPAESKIELDSPCSHHQADLEQTEQQLAKTNKKKGWFGTFFVRANDRWNNLCHGLSVLF